jgi:formate dehydrogenase subunit beta
MSTTSLIEVSGHDPLASVRGFLKNLLADPEIESVFTPVRIMGGSIMPSLVTDPDQLDLADPFAPAFPLNSATQVARFTRGDLEGSIAAILRPCEIRAFTELIKLNQGSPQHLVIIGVDCLGAYTNRDFQQVRTANGTLSPDEMTREFLYAAHSGDTGNGNARLARACRTCEHPVPEQADITLGLFGADLDKGIFAIAQTPTGVGIMNRLDYPDADPGEAREKYAADLVAKRTEERDAMFAETAERIDSPARLTEYLASCVNCYNCRVACPVCYCKECVFVTDVFRHEPWQYQGWAKKGGGLRMPVDTVFFHLTRLAHSSLSCVGCGQCSNACPNDIPVMEMFRLVADRTQRAFDYEAGRSPDEPIPLAVFQEKEFAEVTGGIIDHES